MSLPLNPQQSLIAGKNLIEVHTLKAKTLHAVLHLCGRHTMLERHLRRMYEIEHGVLDGRRGIGQELELPRRVEAIDRTQQTDAALLHQIIHVDVQVAALQRRTPVHEVSRLHDEAHVLLNKEFLRGLITLLSQGAKPVIGHAGRIHRLPPCRSWKGTTF